MTISLNPRRPDGAFLRAHPAHFIALGFGSGLAPRAPGTVGTLAALPLYALFVWLGASRLVIASLLIPAFALGVWACEVTGRALGVPDHGGMVWDEIVAMWAVLVCLPETPMAWGLGFGLFRLFDIVKPWPIGWLDARVKGGFGVMLDDALAAGFALAVWVGLVRVFGF